MALKTPFFAQNGVEDLKKKKAGRVSGDIWGTRKAAEKRVQKGGGKWIWWGKDDGEEVSLKTLVCKPRSNVKGEATGVEGAWQGDLGWIEGTGAN